LPQTLARIARGACLAAALGAAPNALPASSLSGAYLAAMQADFRNDYAAAADYYAKSLLADTDNVALLQNAVAVRTALGDVPGAAGLATQLVDALPENHLAALVVAADALAREQFDAAAAALDEAGDEVINPLLGGLLSGWIEVGRQDFAAAQKRFDAMDGNEALSAYGQYHKALALAFAGDFVSAERILAGAGPTADAAEGEGEGETEGGGPLHLDRGALEAHAQVLAQLGREAEAVDILDAALAGGVPDAGLIDLRDRLAAGEEVAFTRVRSARDGAALAFLTLAEALDMPDSERIALIHARLAQHVSPDMAEAALLVADLLELQGQFGLASAALAEVPETSPWFVTAQIRSAGTLRSAEDPQGAIELLTALAESHPDQIEVHSSLGDALRAEDRFEEAAEAYSDAIALLGTPMPAHWVIYYTRGIANERAGDWEAAEADFRQALEIEPDQPLVLNYLGYSMVEKGENLDEALAMIEKAVAARPDDGYITDSLGWVLYRLDRTAEAVPHMLRAVELTPDDAVINDHLGDVLWKAGRTREAEFQWRRALSFGPAPDLDMERVRRKLEVGLDRVLEEEPAGSDL
jgi:tetratricopeptide (TPR) repeat protein